MDTDDTPTLRINALNFAEIAETDILSFLRLTPKPLQVRIRMPVKLCLLSSFFYPNIQFNFKKPMISGGMITFDNFVQILNHKPLP